MTFPKWGKEWQYLRCSAHNAQNWKWRMRAGNGSNAAKIWTERRHCLKLDSKTILTALKACGVSKELDSGEHIHLDVVRAGLRSNIYVANTLVDMYAKCGSMGNARNVFDGIGSRNRVSWTSLIMGYAKNGEGELALQLFSCMGSEGCTPDMTTFLAALKACECLAAKEGGQKIKVGCLEKVAGIHAQAATLGCDSDLFLANCLVSLYAKCGSMEQARRIFERMARRSAVSWTSLILGYVENDEPEQALDLFSRMEATKDCGADAQAFVAALTACASLCQKEDGVQVYIDGRSSWSCVKIGCLERGMAIHSQAASLGFESNTFICNTLVDMYGKCGSLLDARMVFDKMDPRRRDVVSWNALILGYVDNGEADLALQLFTSMQDRCAPNARTFVAALIACADLVALEAGKRIHAEIRRLELQKKDAFVGNCLVDFYARCGSMEDAKLVFDSTTRDLVTWSTLMAGYSHHGDAETVFQLFEMMRQERIEPDGVTFLSILTACSHAGLIDKGRHYFHIMFSQYGIVPFIEHYHCMIDLLGRANHVDEAFAMVRSMPLKPTFITWSALLGACRKWKNVEVGKVAFEGMVALDPEAAAPYVLMAAIYGSCRMWEEQAKIVAMKTDAGVRKKQPGQSSWTDDFGVVHTFRAGDTMRDHPQKQEINDKLKDMMLKMKQQGGYVADLSCIGLNICDDGKEDALCGHSERLAIACALINSQAGKTIRIVKNLRVCDDCHTATIIMSKIEQRTIICRDISRFHVFQDGKCSCGNFW